MATKPPLETNEHRKKIQEMRKMATKPPLETKVTKEILPNHLEPNGEAWSHLEDDTEEKVGKSLHCFFLISSSMSAKTTSGLKMHILELFMQPEISFGQFQSTGVMQSMQVGD